VSGTGKDTRDVAIEVIILMPPPQKNGREKREGRREKRGGIRWVMGYIEYPSFVPIRISSECARRGGWGGEKRFGCGCHAKWDVGPRGGDW